MVIAIFARLPVDFLAYAVSNVGRNRGQGNRRFHKNRFGQV
jgi:hypothetical protein